MYLPAVGASPEIHMSPGRPNVFARRRPHITIFNSPAVYTLFTSSLPIGNKVSL